MKTFLILLLTAGLVAAAVNDLHGLTQEQSGGGIKQIPLTGVAAGEAIIMDSLGVPTVRPLLAWDISGDSRNRNLTAMSLHRTRSTITGIADGLSGISYNHRSGTLFAVRNQSGLPGTLFEITTDGLLLRTITHSNFVDTEAVEYVTSFRNASGTLYDVLIVAEEDHSSPAQDASLTLCLLTPSATTLDRTATNGTDPDNVTVTTAYSGGTIANSGLESVCYDPLRGLCYYTAEFGTQSGSDNTIWSSGPRQAKILQRGITATAATLSFGAESVLCDISGLFNGGALNGTDISDFTFDVNTDTILAASEASIIDKVSRISRAGTVIESLSTPANQTEGVATSPGGDQLFTAGEVSEFYRYAVAGVTPPRTLTFTSYGSGTAYTLTATSAAVDFGTTDPSITITAPGTYSLSGQVVLNYNGATFAAPQNVNLKFRRTSGTAADVSNSNVTLQTGIVTTTTGTLVVGVLPDVEYATINSNDVLTIFADVAVAPSAGSLQAASTGSYIRAVRVN
jgi:hypothetical protein